MNNNIQISIVLPVYNVVKYLDECVKTILNQTYTEFELIIVDDGSTDGSQALCDCYKSDDRVVVIHQKNGGLSAARNTGIQNSNGKYITFIDSDDFISCDYIEKLYTTIVENDADICMCDFKKVREDANLEKIDINTCTTYNKFLFYNEEAIKEVYGTLYHGIDYVTWAKMYKSDLFKKNDIYFPNGRLHEDTFTTYKLIYCSKKIIYLDDVLYFYRIRGGSITSSTFSLKRLDMIRGTREIYKFFKQLGNDQLMQLALLDHLHKVKHILKMLQKSSDVNRLTIKSVCKDLNLDIEENKNSLSVPKYIYYKGLARFPKLFLLIW